VFFAGETSPGSSKARMKIKKALLVVDVQNDFLPGGALGVPGGDIIVPVVNKYVRFFLKKKYPVLFTRDWHPVRTMHFRDFGGLWPAHCIQGTRGAAFHPMLKVPKEAILLYKGMDPGQDSYSAFHSEDASGRSLSKILNVLGTQELYIAGLATDYCVKYSSLDALKKGLRVRVLVDAVKGVDLKPGDCERALAAVVKTGAKKIKFKELKR